MPIDAASHFSGKRMSERKLVDLRAELRGGGISIEGRAFDLSTQGVGVLLTKQSLEAFSQGGDALSTLAQIHHHLANGVEVRFPGRSDVKLTGQIVRVNTPPKLGADITIGCKFDR